MSLDNRNVLASYLSVSESDIVTDDRGFFILGDEIYAVGDDHKIFNYLIQMINRNAHKYVFKIESAKRLAELGLLSVKHIDHMFYELLDVMGEEELLTFYAKGNLNVKDILIAKVQKMSILTENNYDDKENFSKLKDENEFSVDFSANKLFEDVLIGEKEDYSKDGMRKAVEFIKSNAEFFGIGALTAVIRVFGHRQGTDLDKLAEALNKYGKDNTELVLSLMHSPEKFANDFRDKVKGSFAACLDTKGEVHIVNDSSPVYICNVTGLF